MVTTPSKKRQRETICGEQKADSAIKEAVA